MTRSVNTDVVNSRFDAEGVEEPVVVVRKTVDFVNRDIQLVRAFDQIEAIDHERGLGYAAETLWIQFLEVGVGSVAADAVGIEETDAEHEVLDRLGRAHFHPYRDRIAGVKDEAGLAAPVKE